MAPDRSEDLLNQLQHLLKSVDNDSVSEENRLQASQVARKLWLQLEDPGDLVDRIIFQPMENALLRVAFDLDIYKYLDEQKGAVSSEQLAKASGCDPVLMARILRCLAALSHIDEVDIDSFAANKFTEAFCTIKGVSGERNSWNWAIRAWNAIPAYLKSVGYKNATDPMNTALQQGFNTNKHFFGVLVENGLMEDFQTFMSTYRVGRAEFLDVFPADKQLIEGFDSSVGDGVMLVDIGGGRGHDIAKFAEKFLDRKGGSLILQDQAEVVNDVPKSEVMDVMQHDFFTEQPVKGARAYYFRMIFHDWPDEPSLKILKHTIAAMKPGYSKLLINDIVLPNKGATRYATQSDINMMALLAAMERSEAQWRQLLESAGLRVVKIWSGVPESVIEAELGE